MKWQTLFAAVAVTLLFGGVMFLFDSGFFAVADSVEGLQAYMLGFAPYSHVVFFVLQLLSVVIAPLPSNISAAVGGALFGTWQAFALTMGAVLLGSVTVFCLARVLGRPFVERFVSRKVSEKYLDTVCTKRDAFLVLAFLFPFFPDDVLCILAGLTEISFGRFFAIALCTRPWGLLFASALGAAALEMPLWAMVLMGAAGLVIFLVGIRYAERAERWLTNIILR